MYSTRCFIAVPLGPPASSKVIRLLDRMQGEIPGVRWTRKDQLHITLKFLGELDNRDLLNVCQGLRQVCVEFEPFTANLDGLGTFPKNKPPKVIWARIAQGRESFVDLYERIEQILGGLDIPQDHKAYAPHLTLGRVGRSAEASHIASMLQAASADVDSEFSVDEVVIYASLREGRGVVYEPIETIEL